MSSETAKKWLLHVVDILIEYRREEDDDDLRLSSACFIADENGRLGSINRWTEGGFYRQKW